MPAYGFGQAAQIIVGQLIGAGKTREAKHTGVEISAYTSVFMFVMGFIFFFGGSTIARLFTDDAEVISLFSSVLKVAAFFQIFDGSQIILSMCLRAAGDTTFLFITVLCGVWGILVPGAFICVRVLGLGLPEAWLCVYIYVAAIFTVYTVRYFSLKWDKIASK
jgi:Na+-driven multidrug efflux pump